MASAHRDSAPEEVFLGHPVDQLGEPLAIHLHSLLPSLLLRLLRPRPTAAHRPFSTGGGLETFIIVSVLSPLQPNLGELRGGRGRGGGITDVQYIQTNGSSVRIDDP